MVSECVALFYHDPFDQQKHPLNLFAEGVLLKCAGLPPRFERLMLAVTGLAEVGLCDSLGQPWRAFGTHTTHSQTSTQILRLTMSLIRLRETLNSSASSRFNLPASHPARIASIVIHVKFIRKLTGRGIAATTRRSRSTSLNPPDVSGLPRFMLSYDLIDFSGPSNAHPRPQSNHEISSALTGNARTPLLFPVWKILSLRQGINRNLKDSSDSFDYVLISHVDSHDRITINPSGQPGLTDHHEGTLSLQETSQPGQLSLRGDQRHDHSREKAPCCQNH